MIVEKNGKFKKKKIGTRTGRSLLSHCQSERSAACLVQHFFINKKRGNDSKETGTCLDSEPSKKGG